MNAVSSWRTATQAVYNRSATLAGPSRSPTVAGPCLRAAFSSSPSPRERQNQAAGRRKQPALDDEEEAAKTILLTGVPATALPSDVLRRIDQEAGPGQKPPAAGVEGIKRLSRLVAEVKPLYKASSFQRSAAYLIKMVEKHHVDRVADHLAGKLLNGLTPAKVARPSAGHLNSLRRMNVVGFETSLDETEADYSIRRGHFDAVSDFIHAVLAQAPGRVVLLRGLPPGFPAKNLEQRLARSYLLADADRSRMRYWDRREKTWTTTKVAPVIKLETATSANPQPANRQEREEGADVQATLNAESSSMYLVRLQDALDAQRLYRRFNRMVWRYVSSSGLRQKAHVIQSKRESVGEMPDTKMAGSREGMDWMEEEGEDDQDLESLFRISDKEAERSNRAISRDSEKSSSSAHFTKVAFGNRYYWKQPVLRGGETARDARRYVVEAQVMY